ncbi:MAG: VOC family protein [Caldilineaceae bacterium]|nr:VOC family protein [Caldilineaceae bacterium]
MTMTQEEFRVEQIDHVELFVPDRQAAAAWYAATLGIAPLAAHADWAADAQGPLMISSDGGRTMIALFTGEAQGRHPVTGVRRIAFRVDGAGFLAFLRRLADYPVFDRDGRAVQTLEAVDHDKSWSVYFFDPYGTPLEVTTYDYTWVRDRLLAGDGAE